MNNWTLLEVQTGYSVFDGVGAEIFFCKEEKEKAKALKNHLNKNNIDGKNGKLDKIVNDFLATFGSVKA